MLFGTVLSHFVEATGPSFIQSNMRPVSINGKGDILCRSRYTHNDMGSHRFMKISYGYCVISKGSLYEFQTHEFDPDIPVYDDVDVAVAEIERLDSIYNSTFDTKRGDNVIKSFNDKYNFTTPNVDKYKVDRMYTLPEFNALKKLKDLTEFTQKGLRGARSTTYLNRIYIEYDFGDIVILRNKVSYECVEYDHEDITDNCFGSNFDYSYPFLGEDMEYEWSDITGVLFLTDH